MTTWTEVHEPPCRWCAVWIGPHRHMLRADGTPGLVVQALPPSDPVRYPANTTDKGTSAQD